MQNYFDAYDYKRSSDPQTQRGLTLLSLANPQDGDEILDVGCGDGRTTWHLFYANTNVKSITGIDISDDQIKAAKKLSKPNLPHNNEWLEKTNFICGDFLDEDQLKNQNFDLIFSNTAIHWIGSEAYQKIYSLLKEDGRICIEQCAFGDLQELHDVCNLVITEMDYISFKFKDWKLEDHGYWLPKEDELISVLEKAGFKNIDVKLFKLTYPEDYSEYGIYEAFLASSLHKYYDVIQDDLLCRDFTGRVRSKFLQGKTPANVRRWTISATKC